ncbi:MAG: FKBP-type peptidyl-prolyl cis-trans isomerase [Saprospiraceae bacterium]|nr:FKBP-type peptidyl-prolyl cis-trans isomerase [Saprospiraceae bacterium]
MKNDTEKLSYALGVNIGLSLKPQGVKEIDVELLVGGINDIINGSELQMEKEEVGNVLKAHFERLQTKMNEEAKAAQKNYFTENGQREGVVTLESGLQYEIINEGKGPKPSPSDQVTTHYHGMLLDGTVFDSSVDRDEPATFPVNGVIAGWVEALQLMPVGSKWKLFIPSDLAYGERGAGNQIPPNTPLIFDIELLAIK